ncbi:MAG: hypothetical protein IKN53_05845, partial [Oscillibacter sp.]|nr:hypothetical protein [Oscillibacter sp.]
MKSYATIALDVSALPKNEPFFDKLAPIFRTRVEERSGAKVTDKADYTVSFALNKALAPEAFELRDTDRGAEIAGADFNALVFGMGCFLHKSRYGADGVEPTAWRGVSVPQSSLRCIYFAMHFFNWYQQCSQEEFERYIEDLMLWGLNTVAIIYPRMNLTSWDDPNAEKSFGLLRKVFSAAKKMNMKTVYQSSNQDFMIPDPRYAADRTDLLGAANLVCPGTEDGYQYMKSLFMPAVVEAAKIGLDYICFFSYDEGGCHCENCWPWPGKGQYNYAKRMSREIKEELNLPNLKTILATWYYGRGKGHETDWPSFYDRIREDEAKGDDWIDLIYVETRDHPSNKYILEHGRPSEKIKVATFPDVCMMGFEPWGCCGAQVAVTQVFSEH